MSGGLPGGDAEASIWLVHKWAMCMCSESYAVCTERLKKDNWTHATQTRITTGGRFMDLSMSLSIPSPLILLEIWQAFGTCMFSKDGKCSTVGQLALTKSPWWGSDKKANLVKQKYDPLLLWNCQAITYFGRLLLNWPSSVAFLSQPNTHTIVDFRLVSHVREKDQNEFLWVVMKQKLIFNGLKLKSRITFVCFKRKGLVLLMFNKARFRFFF